MKETLYRKKHPLATFTRIRFDQVDHFGSNYIGREIADFITLSKYTSYDTESIVKDIINNPIASTISSSSSSTIYTTNNNSGGLAGVGGIRSLHRPGREGWLARQALRQLNSALEFNHNNNNKQSKVGATTIKTSNIYDNVYGDTEEDNS